MLSKRALWVPLFVSLWSAPLVAHDIYSHLLDENGFSCCSEKDRMPAKFWVTSHGVRMLVRGRWIAVPSSKIQYRILPEDTGETGGGHWCGWSFGVLSDPLGENDPTDTRCAILPPRFGAMSPSRR